MLKTTIHFPLIILIALLTTASAYGQSMRIEYGEDTTVNVGKYDRIYQMVSEQKVNINTLWKFDAVQWGQIQPSVTVEQRLWKDISVEPNFTLSSFKWSRPEGINFALNPNLDFKYYFNRARRERLGKNVIGFSADYFSFGMSYTFTDDKVFYSNELGENYIKEPNEVVDLEGDYFSYFSWHVMYGLQRKIGTVGYADIAGGFERNYFGEYGTSKIIPTIRIKLGFALSTEQFKRVTR